MQHRGGVFGMELRADEPRMVFQRQYLHQAGVGIHAHALHAVCLKVSLIAVVELITVSVALVDDM